MKNKKLGKEEIYKLLSNKPVNRLLLKALKYTEKGYALDLGCGLQATDSIYLVEQGFKVLAIDEEDYVRDFLEKFRHINFNLKICTFKDYKFPKDKFSLINAQFSLTQNSKDLVLDIFNKVKLALTTKGVFTGQVLHKNKLGEIIFTKNELYELFEDYLIIKLRKSSNYYNFIVKKIF